MSQSLWRRDAGSCVPGRRTRRTCIRGRALKAGGGGRRARRVPRGNSGGAPASRELVSPEGLGRDHEAYRACVCPPTGDAAEGGAASMCWLAGHHTDGGDHPCREPTMSVTPQCGCLGAPWSGSVGYYGPLSNDAKRAKRCSGWTAMKCAHIPAGTIRG